MVMDLGVGLGLGVNTLPVSPCYTTPNYALGHYSVHTDPALHGPLTDPGCMYVSYFTSMVTLEVKVEWSSDLRAEFRNGSGVEFQLESRAEQSSDLEAEWNLEQQKCEMGCPLTQPHKDPYNPCNFPLRTCQNLQETLEAIDRACGPGDQDQIGMEHGVHRLLMVLCLPSIYFPHSFLHDIMHIFSENICPTLVGIWTGHGKFKNLTTIDTGYHIAPHVWAQIGLKTMVAYKTIPSDFVSVMPDIMTTKYKAEYWSFWCQYLRPLLLQDCFPNANYYWHFLDLIGIIKQCLQFMINEQEIDDLQISIIKWVKEYERLSDLIHTNIYFDNFFLSNSWYYTYQEQNLISCTFNHHMLLHIPDYIHWYGLAWYTWAFPMERFCSKLGTHVTLWLHPYITLAMYLKCTTQLSQLKVLYPCVWEHLAMECLEGALIGIEKQYNGCEYII